MRNLNEQEKRDLIQQIIIELSKSQDVLKDSKDRVEYFLRLESIYYNMESDNFRHFYSDIFGCLSLVDGDPMLGNLDILAQNMQTIKDGYIPKNKDEKDQLIDISKEIVKLYDHVNLDIGRINYTKRMTGEANSELSKAKGMIKSLQEQLSESEKAHKKSIERFNNESARIQKEVSEGQKKMQNDYITILGIFSSIVLAFTGGMAFSSSVLENFHKASIYRIVGIILILGLILYNLIWLLIDFLREISKNNIRKWWISILANAILISGLILTIIAYKGQWLSNDKKDIPPEHEISTVEESHISLE